MEQPISFLMLNPSVADEVQNDRTVARVEDYARSWGYGGVIVLNVFPYVDTVRANLVCDDRDGKDCGQKNVSHMRALMDEGIDIVLAFGSEPTRRLYRYALDRMRAEFQNAKAATYALATNHNGTPAHPLYQRKSITPVQYDWSALSP